MVLWEQFSAREVLQSLGVSQFMLWISGEGQENVKLCAKGHQSSLGLGGNNSKYCVSKSAEM